MTIRLSAYRNVWDTTPQVLTFDGMSTLYAELKADQLPCPEQGKDHAPLLSQPAEWSTLERRNINVLTLGRALLLDVDKLTETQMVALLESMRGVSVIVYTSYNHGTQKPKDKPEDGLCRFRLIIELDREYPAAEHAAVWSAANARIQGMTDPQTKDPSHMYTVPLIREGKPEANYLDVETNG